MENKDHFMKRIWDNRRSRIAICVMLVLWIVSAGLRGKQSYDQEPLADGYINPVRDFVYARDRGCFDAWEAFKGCRFAYPVGEKTAWR